MSISFNCTSIFCDDIRHEVNGKISLMGIYGNDMYVPVFPITLPKICAYFELRVPPSDLTSNMDVILTVMKGAEKINSITLTLPAFENAPKTIHGKPYVYSRSSGGMEFPSMTFDEPTLLEVTAQVDGRAIVGGRLWVTTFPQSDTALSADVDN